MGLRIGRAFMLGLNEGAGSLLAERDRRMAMARKYSLLNAEKKLIAMREQLNHQYRMQELEKQFEMNLAMKMMDQMRGKQLSPEEKEEMRAKTEYWQAQADRQRRIGQEDEETERERLEKDLQYFDRRIDEISFETKVDDELPKKGVYQGYEKEYKDLQRKRDEALVRLGRMDPQEYEYKWSPEKPNPADLGLVPAGLQTPGSSYGETRIPAAAGAVSVGGVSGPVVPGGMGGAQVPSGTGIPGQGEVATPSGKRKPSFWD